MVRVALVHKNLLALAAVLACITYAAATTADESKEADLYKEHSMNLGNFSISLAVGDLEASRAFYEKLGFTVTSGEVTKNFLILRNGDATLGLFHGMFDKHIMTFNPGWSKDAERLEEFTDVREIQRRLKGHGVELTTEADETTKGRASLTVVDPDGNPILIDQHVE